MKRIKIFSNEWHLQEAIDIWIEKENPDIISISSSIAGTQHSTYILITVLYDDNKDLTIN